LALAPADKKLWGRKAAVLEALGRAEEAAAAKKKLAELGG
jgi:Flp pilus assembly protein TadD